MKQKLNFADSLPAKDLYSVSPLLIYRTWGITILLLSCIYAFNFWTNQQLNKEYNNLFTIEKTLTENLLILSNKLDLKKNDKTLAKQIDSLTSNLANKAQLIEYFKNSNPDARGFSSYLLALANSPIAGLWFTDIYLNQESNEVRLTGKTFSSQLVPDFLHSLAKQKRFASTKFKTIHIQASQEKSLRFILSTNNNDQLPTPRRTQSETG